jgi:hypothetical protein
VESAWSGIAPTRSAVPLNSKTNKARSIKILKMDLERVFIVDFSY